MTTASPEVARVSILGTFNSRPFVNVLHFYKKDLTALTVANLAALNALLAGAAATTTSWLHVFQSMDTGAVINEIRSRSAYAAVPRESNDQVNLAGTSAANDAPPMLAVLTRWQTDIASRRFRGRTYLPGVNINFIDATDSDRITSAQAVAMETRSDAFATAWAGHATFGFCVYSKEEAEDNVTTPYSPVTGSTVDRLLAIQRRRRG